MFQLIVAVISIALVAALAIASIFYGGEAFTKSSDKAHVTALVNQAQQISGAYQLYKTDNGTAPATIADLVSGGYLASLPTPPKVAADGAAWELDATTIDLGNGVAPVAKIIVNAPDADEGICVEVVRQAGGTVNGNTVEAADNPQFGCVSDEGDPAEVTFAFKL